MPTIAGPFCSHGNKGDWIMMSDGMMDGMMWGMGLFWLLILVVLLLAGAALIKYLFFDGRNNDAPKT